jgi:hypothetical protein
MPFPLDPIGCRQWTVSGTHMSVGRGGIPLFHHPHVSGTHIGVFLFLFFLFDCFLACNLEVRLLHIPSVICLYLHVVVRAVWHLSSCAALFSPVEFPMLLGSCWWPILAYRNGFLPFDSPFGAPSFWGRPGGGLQSFWVVALILFGSRALQALRRQCCLGGRRPRTTAPGQARLRA